MKTTLLFLMLCLSSIQPAKAGGGAAVGGASEHTQVLNNIELAASTLTQAQHLIQAQMDYALMLRNLANNPMGLVHLDTRALVANQARIMAAGQDIGNTMAKADAAFAKNFGKKDPTNAAKAQTYADQYQGWSTNSLDALNISVRNAGLHRESFASDQAALQALVDKNQASDGNLGAIKTLGEVNTAQLGESIKLRDLISSQQLATSTSLAAQVAKDQALRDSQEGSMGGPSTGKHW